MNTRGIHIIWATYGSWLPGDPRGHWSPLFDFYGRLVRAGHQLNLPDPVTHRYAASLLQGPEKILSMDDQDTVASLLGAFVRPGSDRVPGLRIHAAAIERTHVHLLTGPVSVPIDRLVGKMKSQTSSALSGYSFLDDPDPNQVRRNWVRGYWKVFLFDDGGVRAVQRYVEEHNVRRGFSARRFLWVDPI